MKTHSLICVDRLIPNGLGNGKEHISDTLIQCHGRLGHEVSLAVFDHCPQQDLEKYSEKRSINLIKRDGTKISLILRKLLSPDIKLYYKLHQWLAGFEKNIKRENIPKRSIVSIWSTHDAGYFAYMLFRIYGIPYVIWEHRTDYQRGKLFSSENQPLWAKVLDNAEHVGAVSPQLISKMTSSFSLKRKDLQVIPNPVQSKFFFKSIEPREDILHRVEERFLFGSWQNWERQMKRLDVLLNAFKMLLIWHKEVMLLLVGNHPKNLTDICRTLGIDNHVLIMSRSSHSEIPEIARTIDALVISSDHETFGNPVVEAMACGKPVVTTACGGPESIVVSEKLGEVVAPSSPRALAQAMLKCVGNRDKYDSKYISDHCYNHYSETAFENLWGKIHERPNKE